MSDITPNARVTHRNAVFSYGDGTVLSVDQPKLPGRLPTHAWVRFDRIRNGRPDGLRVEIANLTVIVTPAPMPGSRETARICWPPERAGEPVMPGAA